MNKLQNGFKVKSNKCSEIFKKAFSLEIKLCITDFIKKAAKRLSADDGEALPGSDHKNVKQLAQNLFFVLRIVIENPIQEFSRKCVVVETEYDYMISLAKGVGARIRIFRAH